MSSQKRQIGAAISVICVLLFAGTTALAAGTPSTADPESGFSGTRICLLDGAGLEPAPGTPGSHGIEGVIADCQISGTFCDECEDEEPCIIDTEIHGTCTELEESLEISEEVTAEAGRKVCMVDGEPYAFEETEEEEDETTSSVAPDLAIDIPGLGLSEIRRIESEDQMHTTVEVPWLADYIVGVYRYAVFVGSILSIIMIMIGGLQWLTAGGNASKVGAAKNRINGAVVGLLLVLGSYLILSTVNPNLSVLNPLRIKVVNPDRYNVKEVLQTTEENTGNPLEMP